MTTTFKNYFLLLGIIAATISCESDTTQKPKIDIKELTAFYNIPETTIDSTNTKTQETAELQIDTLAGPDLIPSPACLATSATGEVFVGVDKIGSLGKEPEKGSIIKLIDTNNDGKADTHTVFAQVDNPRGILSIGDFLYVLHTTFSKETGQASGMDLVKFEDKNKDGIADGASQPLIKNISNPETLKKQGTDHATNGIRMGIDGWIYIAVGDFGFYNATDQDGTQLTMLGGGIVRVRPDGTEMEIYSHGTRNIYDVAIDPFMNIFTRGNTNDGGGWNIRFLHHLQTGEYGYPKLFKNFTDEIIPALADLGGGSGTGSYFMDDNRWPAQFNHIPMMADWGRSELFLHPVTIDGASFTQKEIEFINLAQITDLDVDGSGRMYLAAWDGAGYTGSDTKGFVIRAVPKDWKYEAFPDVQKLGFDSLVPLLKSENAVSRLVAQQEMLSRSKEKIAPIALKIAQNEQLSLKVRVAGIYTYAQASCSDAIQNLEKLAEQDALREFALRALTDRKTCLQNVDTQLFIDALNDPSDRVKVAAIVGLGRIDKPETAKYLLDIPVPESIDFELDEIEGAHATPNSAIIPAHLAVQNLIKMNAMQACIEAIGTKNTKMALWALRYMHNPTAVDGLISAYQKADDRELKTNILSTLARLYTKETDFDGSSWWGTRPDTHGPYYNATTWESSEKIKNLLLDAQRNNTVGDNAFFSSLNKTLRLDIDAFDQPQSQVAENVLEEDNIDLEAIQNKEGQVGEASIEDVIRALDEYDGDPKLGKALFNQQGCIACHSIAKGENLKGPFMGQIGSIMNRVQIAESILKPNASISQGFATNLIRTNDGKSFMGFITAASAEELELRDISGKVTKIATKDIAEREEMPNSMMPTGLANSLSFEEFSSLVTYLSQQK
ncbi:c-type cytochrome [Flavimarina sp. Hel_I_48]|uniref:DUF7133 domain-containing protein n=1 Tax=Flavimarina sp. Hel_I_48 TaxID=1392488 RepID=UPI00055E73C1|nr:c-type cytochrome [Flavimarina sp. Hel_I_48]